MLLSSSQLCVLRGFDAMPTVNVSGYKEANQTLCIPDLKQSLYDEGAVLMDRVLVTLHGDEHRARRLLEMKIFKKDFFTWYETQMLPPVVARMVARYAALGRADLMDFAPRTMIDLTADFAGIDRPLGTDEERDTLVRLLKGMGQAATLGQFSGDREPVRRAIAETIREFDEKFFAPSAERRRALLAKFAEGEIGEDALPRDILTVLLRNEDKVELPRDMMLRETAFYYLAGAHTSVHSLTHAMNEMFRWVESHPEDRPKLTTDPLFVQRCVHESMRLHPSSPIVQRRALCPVHLPSGEDVARDDTVIVDLYKANRQTELFGEDAASFNPYRQLGPTVPPYGLTFGVGVHTCLGRDLAAGTVPKPGASADGHPLGTVTTIALALLRAGARPDAEHPPQRDANIAREAWTSYPILLGEPA
jgi:cytochrome P450